MFVLWLLNCICLSFPLVFGLDVDLIVLVTEFTYLLPILLSVWLLILILALWSCLLQLMPNLFSVSFSVCVVFSCDMSVLIPTFESKVRFGISQSHLKTILR